MSSTTIQFPAVFRISSAALVLIQRFLMISGLVFLLGLAGVFSGNAGLLEGLQALLPDDVSASEAEEVADSPDDEALPGQSVEALNPKMRRALDYVSRHYHVSNEALVPIFATAQAAGHELSLDPLLIIAVIGVESGFNPFSQSVVGAKGLMQVIPRFHLDKVPDKAGVQAFLDPVTNVVIGARVLKESIKRNGGVEEGLQQFAGAINDPERRYSNKVLAERQRLEQMAPRVRASERVAARALAPTMQLAANQAETSEQ
jgi:hypothetical protein